MRLRADNVAAAAAAVAAAVLPSWPRDDTSHACAPMCACNSFVEYWIIARNLQACTVQAGDDKRRVFIRVLRRLS